MERENYIASQILKIQSRIKEIEALSKDIQESLKDFDSPNKVKYSSTINGVIPSEKLLHKTINELQETFFEEEEITDIAFANWHEIGFFTLYKGAENKPFCPKKEGEYICIREDVFANEFIKYRRYFEVLNWSADLYKTDECFKNYEGLGGFWIWDKNNKKICADNVIAWCKLPHIRSNEELV